MCTPSHIVFGPIIRVEEQTHKQKLTQIMFILLGFIFAFHTNRHISQQCVDRKYTSILHENDFTIITSFRECS